jgi:mannose-6-phosphate isomerase-like protein (cupin superfamily)
MENVNLTQEELLARVARFADLAGSGSGFPDSDLPGCRRVLYNIFGYRPPRSDSNGAISPIGSVNSQASPIELSDGYSLAIVEATPANGTILHNHDTTETFVIVTGRWRFVANEDESVSAELGPLDTISFPPGVPRRFENLSSPSSDRSGNETSAHMLVLITDDSPTAVMEPEILEEAKRTGRFTPAYSGKEV